MYQKFSTLRWITSEDIKMTDGNKPIKKFRAAGVLSVAVWENTGTSKRTGEPVKFHTISTDRRYKNKDGEWKSTGTLRINDIPKMVLLLQKAYEYFVLKDTNNGNGNSETIPVNEEEIVV